MSFLDEYSAVVDKKTLEAMYNYATSKPYGFMMVDFAPNRSDVSRQPR